MQENLIATEAPPLTPPRELAAFPQTLYLIRRGWLPPLSAHRASLLTRNRRLGPSQHDGLDPPMDRGSLKPTYMQGSKYQSSRIKD